MYHQTCHTSVFNEGLDLFLHHAPPPLHLRTCLVYYSAFGPPLPADQIAVITGRVMLHCNIDIGPPLAYLCLGLDGKTLFGSKFHPYLPCRHFRLTGIPSGLFTLWRGYYVGSGSRSMWIARYGLITCRGVGWELGSIVTATHTPHWNTVWAKLTGWNGLFPCIFLLPCSTCCGLNRRCCTFRHSANCK